MIIHSFKFYTIPLCEHPPFAAINSCALIEGRFNIAVELVEGRSNTQFFTVGIDFNGERYYFQSRFYFFGRFTFVYLWTIIVH